MNGKLVLRMVVMVLGSVLVAACITVSPTLKTTPTVASVGNERLALEVAVIVPEPVRGFNTAHEIPGACISGGIQFAPVSYGQQLQGTLQDRFARLFERVAFIDPAADRSSFDAVFELGISDVGFRFGCMIAPQQYGQVTASLRAIDDEGREMWRSPTTNARSDAPFVMAIDFNPIIGDAVSQAIGKIVDNWTREVAGMDEDRYAMGASPARRMVKTLGRKMAKKKRGFGRGKLKLQFPAAPEQPDDIAVIIGNGDYGQFGVDIPDVLPAYADMDAFAQYAIEGLGVREGNIIFLRDATGAQMVRVFGSDTNAHGQLFDWVRPGRSRVYVYYSGHGAPGKDGTAFLVPSDADAARIELNGFPLSRLYGNLAKLPASQVTVVLESCFSGTSQKGSVIAKSSAIYVKPRVPEVPRNMTVISAGAADQVASWEQDDSNGLFTKYYLKAVSGEADTGRYGNRDGFVALEEIKAYLADTLTYFARRYYGRDQTSQIVAGGRAMF